MNSKTKEMEKGGEPEKEKPNPTQSKNSDSDLRKIIALFMKINQIRFLHRKD